MAGIVPGVVLTLMFMVYIAIHCTLKPATAPVEAGPRDATEALRAAIDVVPFLLLIGLIFAGIYFGLFTPTEAAALGCVLAVVIGATLGHMRWSHFRAALFRSVLSSGNILFIVFTAYVFSYAISVAGLGEKLTAFLVGLQLSRLEFFGALFVLFTVLGCLVESLGMIVITVPLLYPVLLQYGIDPIWFGIILVVFIELGQISPPIGINLFVIQSLWDRSLGEVVKGTIPFHLIMFLLLLLLVLFPDLALWLPRNMSN
jgi:tripartite ATP-independent transporter DctM subunit